MNQREKILVFIPLYNAETQIPRVLQRVKDELSHLISGILIIDNVSQDESLTNALKIVPTLPLIMCTVLQNFENYGLGGSHKIAFRFASANGYSHVIVLHGDDQADPKDIRQVIESGLHRRYEKLFGSRFMKGSKLIGYSRKRTLANRVLNVLVSCISRRNITDLGSGLNMFSSDFFASPFIAECNNDLTFNNSLIFCEPKPRLTELFFPISWTESDQTSNAKLVRQTFTILVLALKYAANRNFVLNHLGQLNNSQTDFNSKMYYSSEITTESL